ncbi:MAG: phosphate ABC transporter substrate-binding protein PstS [Vulcanimicrobiaceae bacterium]
MKLIRILCAALALTFGTSVAAFAAVELLETGSSLVYPLMNIWVPSYTKAHGDVRITTQSTGSGTGISQAVAGVAQIGASDAYMSDAQLAQGKMLNIPLAISAQQVNYNVPGLNDVHLNLSGPVLAGIYDGSIHFWDDAKIKGINAKYASKLPHETIIPIHRADGSGDTFIFTQYLSFSAPSWKSGPGFGTSVTWPAVQNGVGATGNPGMVQACEGAKYSIAYVGVSFLDQTNKAGLGFAALQNRDGSYVLPTEQSITSAAGALIAKTPKDERISLIFGPGKNSYPIINYEYMIINPKQPNAQTAQALKQFLEWALGPGQSKEYLDQVHFIPLPKNIVNLSKGQISQISA